jgi:hypothetical protein
MVIMDFEVLRERLVKSIQHFLLEDYNLLKFNASERSISHKLATYLEREFEDWDIDCEYNRIRDFPKRIDKTSLKSIFLSNLGSISRCIPEKRLRKTDKTKSKLINPDIVIHKRGKKENLLVIEIKKSNSQDSFKGDVMKLIGLTAPWEKYEYDYGLFLVFEIESSKNIPIRRVCWFKNGKFDAQLTDHEPTIIKRLNSISTF